MSEQVLIDTGPLVAFLGAGSELHEWTTEQTRRLTAPFLTTEPVLTETAHLLKRANLDADVLFELMGRGLLRVGLNIEHEQKAIRQLLRRYRSVPMSLADATLVRLSELRERSIVFTLDSDFRIYRRFVRQAIPLLMPD